MTYTLSHSVDRWHHSDSAWYITGAWDSRWNNSDLHLINGVHASDFEVVDISGLVNGP